MHEPSSTLPWITADEPGIGGCIKRSAESFVVEELPLYAASGSGEHAYLCVRRENQTTRDVVELLARAFGVAARDVGYAGLKDKRARVTQRFSVPVPMKSAIDLEEHARTRVSGLPIELLSAERHSNKLRAGHLAGNRFEVEIEGASPDALDRAARIAALLARRGVPNFFGEQRLGRSGDNARRGERLLATGADTRATRASWAGRFLVSAYQSVLFNAWLVERIATGRFEELIAGDVAKRADSGGLFVVEDVAAERARFDRREIAYTGPIYGAKMPCAAGEPGEIERELLSRFDVDPSAFARAHVAGGRRVGRLFVGDLELGTRDSALVLRFSLPKGAYATVLAREFTKSDESANSVDPID